MHRPLTALPLIVLCAAPAAAQTPPASMQRVEVTGSVSIDARRSDTAGRLTVSRDDLARYGDSTVSEALKRQPGISVVNGDIRMRGLGAGYTQILVNGEPVAQGFSIDSIAPSLIERIEIMRSGSAEYGAQGIAGTINVILKKVNASARSDLTLGVSNRPGYANPTASLRLSDRRGQLAWSLAADLSRTANDYLGQIRETRHDARGALTDERLVDERNYFGATRIGLAPRLAWTLAGGDKLEWQALLERTRPWGHGAMSETVQLGAPTRYPENNWRIASTAHSERSDLTWTRTLSSDATLLVKAGVNRNTRENDYLFSGASTQETLARNVLSNVIDNTATLSGKYLAPIGQAHSLGLGWELGRTSRSEARLQRDTSQAGAPLGMLDEDYQAAITRLSVFAQDEWQVTGRLQAYLGARWEGLHTLTEGRTLESVRGQMSVLSPIASLLWKLPGSEKDQVRLALARSYKAPTSRQLVPRRYTTNNDNGPANPDVRGNPALRPELAWGIDGSYERYFGKSAMFSISAYARTVDQVIVQSLYQENGVWMSSPLNDGRAKVWGVESDAKVALGSRLDLRANAARNWSRLDGVPGPDNRLAEQVAATANLGLDYRHSAALTLGMNLNLQFGGATRLSAQRSTYSGPERKLDTYALWKIDPAMQLRLSGTNLLARDGFSSLAYRDASFATERATTVRSSTQVKLVLEKKL